MADESEAKAQEMLTKLEELGAKVFYEKLLTSSDVSANGRVVVPKVRKATTASVGGGVTCIYCPEPVLVATSSLVSASFTRC